MGEVRGESTTLSPRDSWVGPLTELHSERGQERRAPVEHAAGRTATEPQADFCRDLQTFARPVLAIRPDHAELQLISPGIAGQHRVPLRLRGAGQFPGEHVGHALQPVARPSRQ